MSKLLYCDQFEYADDAAAQAAYVTDAAEVVEANFETDGATSWILGDWAGTDYWRAAKFTISEDIFCSSAAIYIESKSASTPTGDMTLRIETDVGSEPSGTLAHANATTTETPSQPAWVKGTYTGFLLPSGTYWLVCSIPDQADSVYWKWRYGNGGAGTAAYSANGGSTWGVIADSASYFRIYGLPLQSYSESTIKQQGSYSLKGIAVITDSLNDTLTKTLTDYLDYSIMDKLIFQVRSSRTGENLQLQIHDTGGTTSTHTINIASADTWQTETWDISGITGTNRDTIDKIIIKVINADAANTFYFDNLFSKSIIESSHVWIGG